MNSSNALIVEGGGLRGVFASGVLDAFLDADFNPFGVYIGVSAGATNLSSFLSGQRGRSYRLYLDYATHKDFINLSKFLRGGHLMDLDWFWDVSLRDVPFDMDAALAAITSKTFLIVSSSLSTGKALYLEPTRDTWADYLKASSAIPFMYRNTPQIENHLTTDGGVTDPLPVEEAFKRGATSITVIRSRPLSCVKSSRFDPWFVRYALRKHPNIHDAVMNQAAIYSRAQAFMDAPPENTSVQQIAPAQALQTRRAKADPVTLRSDYEHGYDLGQQFVERGYSWAENEATAGQTPSPPQSKVER